MMESKHKAQLVLWIFLCALLLAIPTWAQTDLRVTLSQPDLSDFPTVRLRMRTADATGIPLSDLSGLRLSENGEPITDFEQATVPVGIDVVFVIDANATGSNVNDSGQTQLQKAKESIGRFANRFMSQSGQDRVSIIVPDGSGGARLLLDNESDPATVSTILADTALPADNAAPLNRMMVLALTQLRRAASDNRFQAILLFSDAGQLSQQLDVDGLIAQAQQQDVAIFGALLDPPITAAELDAMTQLARPARGSVVRMDSSADADSIYLIWQRQANQTQLTYRSRLQESGRFPITVSVGGASASTTLNLQLQPPQVDVDLGRDVLRRTGAAPETPLTQLTPTTQPMTVTVTWPDGLPRTVVDVALLVNGRTEPPAVPPDLAADPLRLVWDVRNRGTGGYEVAVTVTDDLGFTGQSDPQLVTIVTARATLPTPTPLVVPPSPVPTPPLPEVVLTPQTAVFAGVSGLLLLGLVLLISWWWRQRAEPEQATAPTAVPPPTVDEVIPTARLTPLAEGDAFRIDRPAITIGRHPDMTLTLDDASVDRRHARIRWRNGRYWLWDESSSGRTTLNHTRLGLTPHALSDGDVIQIGRFSFRFHLNPDNPAPEPNENADS